MKWRMIPSLNVEKLQSTKVLIIGAGTLGCSVARILLGCVHHHDVAYLERMQACSSRTKSRLILIVGGEFDTSSLSIMAR